MDVKTAGRTVEIFEAFAKAKEPLSLSEIGRILNAPLSSCLYLVRALEHRGYLYAVGTRRHIYPTRKLFDVASAIASGELWVERLEPYLIDLRDATLETIILGKRQGTKVIYLAVIEGTQTIRYSSQPGDLKPLHSSSIGKALLANMPEAERKKVIAKLQLHQFTAATIVDQNALLEELKRTAKRGYAQTNGETVADVAAFAKAITLDHDQFALAIAGPSYRMREHKERHVKALEKACEEIVASITV